MNVTLKKRVLHFIYCWFWLFFIKKYYVVEYDLIEWIKINQSIIITPQSKNCNSTYLGFIMILKFDQLILIVLFYL